ncbi:thiamine pyrophosphate-dependent enzyme [Rhodococcus sp. NBC_00297]|uniref:thiamine pyrophosphate-dependent enzyme n=1 Tax=Rhodococcus sp. NBC_00297 TaxID=2976005 RepID=UPI002E2904D0|nr:thiamine pyrophosphate-dependent enzyme [Rhodococcus sp. NBC_00297]
MFGIPGVQTYALFDALADAANQIELIGARHEQACAYMAMGYAQSTGALGVFSAVPGPGILNASAGLLTALGTSTPVLCLTSEIPSDYMGRGFGHVHEMPSQIATLRTVTKRSDNVMHPSHAKRILAQAIHAARSERPGPTVVAAPWDVLGREAPAAHVLPMALDNTAVDPVEIASAAELLAGSNRPVILVGGGAREASATIRALAEHLQAPVIAFRSGKGVVGESSPLSFTCADGYDQWRESDLVLTIGTKAELLWFRWPKKSHAVPSINIDIDPASHIRLEPTVGITADSDDAASALLTQLRSTTSPRVDRRSELAQYKRDKAIEIDAWLQPHRDYLAAIRRALPDDGFFVEEVSQIGFSSYFSFPVDEPRRFITCGHQSNLGFGFPTALGVKAGNRNSVVVSVTGDGGFQFSIQELATAVQYRLGVIVVVFDNGAFGNVKADQHRLFGREVGSTLHNPDFEALALAYGAHVARAETPDELERAIVTASASDLPTVIVVPMPLDSNVTPWRYLVPAPHDL